MTMPSATRGAGLEELATELRGAASLLDSFGSTLASKVAKLQWRGPAADTFRSDAKRQQAVVGHTVTVARQLAAGIDRLVDDIKHAESALRADERHLETTVVTQVDDLEAVARQFHTTVAALLAQNPAITHQLIQEGDRYQALQHQLSTLGA